MYTGRSCSGGGATSCIGCIGCFSVFSGSHGGVDLLSILIAGAWWWRTVPASFTGAHTDDVSVDGAGYAVHNLDVQLRHGIFLVDGSLRDITDRCTLHHVANLEALDGLVLCDTAVAV